jgi:hypothetical protein
MTTFTLNAPYGHQTKSGIKVEYVTKLDRPDGFVHVFKGRIFSPEAEAVIMVNDLGNRHNVLADLLDVIDAPKPKQKLRCWVNFYANGCIATHTTEKEADEAARRYVYESFKYRLEPRKRLACVEVNATEGDGIK